MDEPSIEFQFVTLICYLATSARGLVDEPKLYGPSRLLEACSRLISLAESCGIDRAPLSEAARHIDDGRLAAMHKGEEDFIAFIDEIVALLAGWLGDADILFPADIKRET